MRYLLWTRDLRTAAATQIRDRFPRLDQKPSFDGICSSQRHEHHHLAERRQCRYFDYAKRCSPLIRRRPCQAAAQVTLTATLTLHAPEVLVASIWGLTVLQVSTNSFTLQQRFHRPSSVTPPCATVVLASCDIAPTPTRPTFHIHLPRFLPSHDVRLRCRTRNRKHLNAQTRHSRSR
jgi:hypothetical protein